MKYEYLESVRTEIEKCVRCAACQSGCPTYEDSFSETLSARGKIHLLNAVLDGRLNFSSRLQDDLSMCLSCLNCKTACPAQVDTQKIFSFSLKQINKSGGGSVLESLVFKYVLPYPKRLSFFAKLVGIFCFCYKVAPKWLIGFLPYSPGGVKRVLPNFWSKNLRNILSETTPSLANPIKSSISKVAYFSGCMTDLAFSTTGESVVKHLLDVGVEVVFPKNQVCCGAPAYFGGDDEAFRNLVDHNISVFNELDVDAIVCSCATCASILKHYYSEVAGADFTRFTSKVVDFQQLLVTLGMNSVYKMKKAGGYNIRVTYHDPCHLKRGLGVFEQPRTLIKSLPNVEFIEMEKADRCCGGSGIFSINHYPEAIDHGRIKAESIAKTEADYVVTSCPSCQLHIADALNRFGLSTPVISGPELLDLALQRNGVLDVRK